MIKYYLFARTQASTFVTNKTSKLIVMKNKLFYLFGAVFLLCSISTFTACSEDNSDTKEEIPSGGDGNEDEDSKWEISGEYSEGNENTLKMMYNGEELTGKKVTVIADENSQTASIVLEGTEKDLGAMLSGIIDLKCLTYSPIPGENKITLNGVTLTPNKEGTAYQFKGEDRNETRVMTYKGIVNKGEMNIEITNELSNNLLAGTWNLAPVDVNIWGGVNCTRSAPLWIDWDSFVEIDPGEMTIGDTHLSSLNQSPNSLFTWILVMLADPSMSSFGVAITVEQWIANMLKSVVAQPNGCMYATYSYSGNLESPQWSDEMGRNILRYYYGEKPNQIYIEANIDFIINALGGLLTKTRAEGGPNEVIQKLMNTLRPVLEKGFPCTYEINGNEMRLYLDGEFTLKALREFVDIANEPTLNQLIMALIESDATLAPYATNVDKLLKTLPNALTYKGNPDNSLELSGECKYIKIGFKLVKAVE